MNNLIKKIIDPLYYTVIDRYAFTSKTPHWKKIFYTTRYKLGSKGVFLTENEKKIKKLENLHSGKRCFVIGNGPSLNKLDLTRLKNEYTFGVNAIYLNYEKMGFYPTYYVVEDYFVAEDRQDEINNYKESEIKFFGAYLDYVIKKDDKTLFLNVRRNYRDKKNFPLFSDDCVRYLGVGGSVTYVCLQLAYYMGFSEVYMIGFDHNYVIPNSSEISNQDRKTGFDILSKGDDPNHFNPSYFGKGYRWHEPNVERITKGFEKARDFFTAHGRKIYNATEGGKLEIFERVPYKNLFA